MGVRIEPEDGEPIKAAVRRLHMLILSEGAFSIYTCKWHKRRHDCYLKPSILNRRRRWIIRVRKLGCGPYNPDWDYEWADDLEMRPRRSMGPLGRSVVT